METSTGIEDEYGHEGNVEYILENVLMPDDGSPEFKHLQDEYNCQLTLCCKCTSNYSCKDSAVCCHGGGLEYNPEYGELVLITSAAREFPTIVECNDLCECDQSQCRNRLVQFGPRKKLEIYNSPLYKSKGLRTSVAIPRGAFICEYAGELLTLPEAQRRLELIDKTRLMNYILYLCEYAKPKSHKSKTNLLEITIVDPSRRGNIGRYLNHSCEPNCEILAVRTNCPIPKIAIFAKRNINVNEELCFHYAGENFDERKSSGKLCLCGASNCCGFMPNTKI
ncbi:LOW QUALITY PROTEIN: probable histone-lysine N-methyltransferase set-23 [Drosophila grimshawi]|uniref:LOW QUALITY PROTEIN: probable histone-lysine N-methyltransferase set-23 n=1 Tax=Drosophila grimshawi TaxID=7222 RepID=UPI001C936F49|nr:LOW QUALITY PROTEIN: probable histone-lysine N-methyltransferase set-23 [Drosophila grimshawi]